MNRRLLVHVNIQTGEGFCRIQELWDSENFSTQDELNRTVKPIDKPVCKKQAAITAVVLPPPDKYPAEIKNGLWSDVERQQLKYMMSQGVPDEEMAKILGRPLQGVKRVKRSIIRQVIMGCGKLPGQVVNLFGN